ncbi:alpha/beta hydrolase [Sphingorhabdus sp. M41]|uniref:alpha/beta hydrolase n=1 Tax=Sphingorhabdus sp. M41 TaxID=1806885 RepID=UPI00078C6013|nr:alpha/beta hydrolase [Sphingorhabdus sp. M41]AMO73479.1 hypothetical protein AZE99_14290 [Sphingorhabdus sp. M41]
MRKTILIAVVGVVAASPLLHAQTSFSPECRREVVKLCGADRSNRRACIIDKADQLSAPCRTALRERVGALRDNPRVGQRQNGGQRASGDQRVSGGTEYAYGPDPLQRLVFYPAKVKGEHSPLIIFVHGGGWKRGDLSNATGRYKPKHYPENGYAFATINYRLVPDATVEQAAADVAKSIEYLVGRAAVLGFDPRRVVLMGHSAGAHLAALVGTDPQYLRAVGLEPSGLAGVIPLDGAAYDVPLQMVDGNRFMQKTYSQAFGTDPARQWALSPTAHAAAPNARSFLILHIERADGTRQSKALAEQLRAAGTAVQINAVEGKGLKGHAEINRSLGNPDYPATAIVDKWLADLFR